MLSKRALAILSAVFVSLLLIAISSHSLGYWDIDPSTYSHLPGLRPDRSSNPYTPGSNDEYHDDDVTDNDKNENTDEGAVDQPPRPHDPACDAFPDTSNLLVVMKTGATESRTRVPTQLMTMLKCLPEFYIFSDLDETIAGYHIRDSLDTVLDETKQDNRDFDLYRRQKACAVDQESCNKLSDSEDEGWALDKYKNVHIAEKVYALRPDYDWYLFIDADTYVLFPTLARWLPSLDHTKPHYLGSITMLRGYVFAHGGSGYLVSQAAMRGIGDHPGIANELEPYMQKECCGDYVFGLSVDNTTGTRAHNVWPTVNGEKPFTIPYGPNHWCQPIVTMHHLNSEEVSSFHAWESARYGHVTCIKDIYDAFVAPILRDARDDWDNRANDRYYLREDDPNGGGREFSDDEKRRVPEVEDMSETEKRAHESFEACGEACAENTACLSYRWQDGLCGLGWTFRLGHPKPTEMEERKRYMSGWHLGHIRAMAAEKGDCGGTEVDWPEVP